MRYGDIPGIRSIKQEGEKQRRHSGVFKNEMMQWNYTSIRKRSIRTTFLKGRRSWLRLVIVGFIFSFIGASNSLQTTFIDIIDNIIGANDPLLPGNIDVLKEYIVETPIVKSIPFITSDFAVSAIDSASKSATWILKFLAANLAYFNRNKGEVVAALFIGAAIAMIYKYFVSNVVIVGQNRYAMENRFSKDVSLKRIFAPFHAGTLMNVVKVMLLYRISILLWSLTVVGGIYKYYQYYAVPYLVAENPEISWKEAKKLSIQMTDGFKRKIFFTQLSFFYIWILKAIPIAGLAAAVPLEMSLNAEMYFALRENPCVDNALFVEPAFNGKPYTEEAGEPVYALSDPTFSRPNIRGKLIKYRFVDYVFMFFTFCLMGYVWECILFIFYEHALINRGSMYGPWIPIYGIGGFLIITLLDRFKGNKIKFFISSVALCSVLEYLTSFFLEFIFNSSSWDYNSDFLNLNGRICFAGMVAFGFGSMSGMYIVAPAISNFSVKLKKKYQIIIAAVLCTAFAVDFICCLIFGFNSGRGVGGNI